MIEVITAKEADAHIARKRRALQPEVVQVVATRAAMLERQGIDADLSYSAVLTQELEATYQRERADRLLFRVCCAAVLALVFLAYARWAA